MAEEESLLPLLVSLMAAVCVGGGLRRFGGRKGRPWAVPAATAILLGGAGSHFDLPDWAVVAAVLGAPFLFHRTVRGRLAAAARGCARLEVPEVGVTLRRVPDYSGKHVGLWTAASERGDAAPDPHALVLALDFVGEADDEYEVVVRGESPVHLRGELVVHHRDAQGPFASILAGESDLRGLPGLSADWSLRTLPDDYGFEVVDAGAMAVIHEVFDLRNEEREVYIHVRGRSMRIGATGTFSASEIPLVLSAAARLFMRLRALPESR